jgi:pyruvate/2-oxoglutarate dehydrogenase complex dihydrolipoamide acyltransferase (E2) component
MAKEKTAIRSERLRGWRRLAVAIWAEPGDPQMRGDIEVDAGPALAYIEEAREHTGVHLTIVHLVGRALGHAIAAHPDLNVLPHRDRLTPRDRVDVSFIVAFDEGRSNAAARIRDVDRKPAISIARELEVRAEELRSHADAAVDRFGRIVDRVPLPLLRLGLRAGVWLTVDRGVDLGLPGLEPGGFGSALVTSIGGIGIDHGYPMITPFSRVPIAIAVGRIARRPVAIEDQVVIRPMLTLSAAMDHRYLDGFQAAQLIGPMRAYLADPRSVDGPITTGVRP